MEKVKAMLAGFGMLLKGVVGIGTGGEKERGAALVVRGELKSYDYVPAY